MILGFIVRSAANGAERLVVNRGTGEQVVVTTGVDHRILFGLAIGFTISAAVVEGTRYLARGR